MNKDLSEERFTAPVPEGRYKWYHKDGREEWFDARDIEMDNKGWWRPKKYNRKDNNND